MLETLADRMRDHETVARNNLMRRTPVIIRVTGRGFSKLVRDMDRPYDPRFLRCMEVTAFRLASDVQNCRIAFQQSDEVSLLLTDFRSPSTEGWFRNDVQRMCSVASSIATAAFMSEYMRQFSDEERAGRLPVFECSSFNVPREDVSNYFIWRQRCCERDAISSVAQMHFSQKDLQGTKREDVLSMLLIRKGIKWDEYDIRFRQGLIVTRELQPATDLIVRSRWVVSDAPIMAQSRDVIERHLLEEEPSA